MYSIRRLHHRYIIPKGNIADADKSIMYELIKGETSGPSKQKKKEREDSHSILGGGAGEREMHRGIRGRSIWMKRKFVARSRDKNMYVIALADMGNFQLSS